MARQYYLQDCMTEAYNALSGGMKSYLEGLEAVHSWDLAAR